MATVNRKQARAFRRDRVRKTIRGTESQPRLTVFRSLTATYVQVISDTTGTVLASASTSKFKVKSKKNVEAATLLGKQIAETLLEKKISQVVFDRNGYQFHGRIKAVANGAREAGLKF